MGVGARGDRHRQRRRENHTVSTHLHEDSRKERRDAPFLDDGVEELEPLDVVVAEVAVDLADLLAQALLHLGVARKLEEREAERARRRLVADHDEPELLQVRK